MFVCSRSIWKCWFLRRGENRRTWRKTSRNKKRTNNKPNPTYGVDAEIWTRATSVRGERSYHYATLALLETRTFPQVDFVTRWPNQNGLLWKPWWNRRGYYLLALIAYVYVNDPSVDERNKRASSKKAIEWASEKKGIKTAAFILLIKGLICLQNCSRLSACGPRAARI